MLVNLALLTLLAREAAGPDINTVSNATSIIGPYHEGGFSPVNGSYQSSDVASPKVLNSSAEPGTG